MGKEVFDQSIEDMLELDPSLDINAMLDTIPAIDTAKPPVEKKTEVDDEKELEEADALLKDINKVLETAPSKDEDEEEEVPPVVEKKPKAKDKAPAPIEQTTEKSSDAPFTVIFARDLVAQGLLSSFDEDKFNEDIKEVGEADALRNLIKTEIDANIEAARTDLDEGYQQYLQMVGKGVPAETAGDLTQLKNKFESIKAEALKEDDNLELRKQVLIDYYKLTTSLSDAKIEKMVQTTIDLGDDVEEAIECHNTLKTLIKDQITAEEQEAAKRQKLQEEENRRHIEALKETINSLNEVIPGMPVNKKVKTTMFESLTKPVQDNKGRTTNALWAKRAEDPSFFDQRLAYLYATGFFEKDKPWNKLSEVKVTKEVSALEQVLKSKNNTSSRTGESVMRAAEIDKTSKDNIESMRGIFGR